MDDLVRAVDDLEAGDYTSAETKVRKILRSDPKNYFALQILRIALRKMGHAEEATQALQQSVAAPMPDISKPQNFQLLDRIMKLTMLLADNTYLNVKPEAFARANMGAEAARAGDFDLAKKLLDEAIRIDKNCELAHFNRGILAFNTGDYSLAETCMREVLRINPANRKALDALSDLRNRK